TLGDRFRLEDEDMNDLPGLFARLHDDHYRIYFVRTENQSYRLVIDVVTRDGRMTVPGDTSSGIRDRPPEAVEAGQAPEANDMPLQDAPLQLPPGALLEEIESSPLPEGESTITPPAGDLAAADQNSSDTRSTSA